MARTATEQRPSLCESWRARDLAKWIGLLLFSLLQCVAPAAHAGSVSVSRLAGNELQLVAEDATTGEVLAHLAKHEGFAITGALLKPSLRRLSVRLRGSLDDLLVRLMRNESFSLVYAASAPGKIERIVLTGAQTSRIAADEPATRDGRATSMRSSEPVPRAYSHLHDAPAQGVPVPTADANRTSGNVPSAIVPVTQGLPTPLPMSPSSVGLFSGGSVPMAGVGENHAIGSHPK